MNIVSHNQSPTMTSSQLAEMLGKQKKHINEKIRSMFGNKIDGQIIRPSFDSRGYVIEYHLPELESKMFVAKHDIDYLETITKFWISKGEAAKPSWIANLSPEAKIAIEDLSKQIEVKDTEIERLQGVCNTVTAQFAPGLTISTLCKSFNGVNIMQVNNTLIKMGMLIKTRHGHEPSSYARDNYFTVSFDDFEKPDGSHGQRSKVTLTLKGAKWLYKAYLSNKLPMKKSWDGSLVHVEFEVKQ